jgi:hypothetical protein
MSKLIWESETEQGVIRQSHIVAIKSLPSPDNGFEMYDVDCKVYPLSQLEFEQLSGQMEHDEFILLEAASVKYWISKEHFTDAICDMERCEIGGWAVHPLIFAELIKYIKARKERKMAKKAAKESEKALEKTPDGIKKLIAKETEKHNAKIMELQKQHDFLMKNPAAMV